MKYGGSGEMVSCTALHLLFVSSYTYTYESSDHQQTMYSSWLVQVTRLPMLLDTSPIICLYDGRVWLSWQ